MEVKTPGRATPEDGWARRQRGSGGRTGCLAGERVLPEDVLERPGEAKAPVGQFNCSLGTRDDRATGNCSRSPLCPGSRGRGTGPWTVTLKFQGVGCTQQSLTESGSGRLGTGEARLVGQAAGEEVRAPARSGPCCAGMNPQDFASLTP